MSLVPYTYIAKVTSVYDGDTFRAVVDLGFGFKNHGTAKTVDGVSFRVLGINTRETTEPGGPEVRDYVRSLLEGKYVTLHSVKDDKYGGRYLAVVDIGGTDLATHLIEQGWAAPWDGEGEKPLPAWPREVLFQ